MEQLKKHLIRNMSECEFIRFCEFNQKEFCTDDWKFLVSELIQFLKENANGEEISEFEDEISGLNVEISDLENDLSELEGERIKEMESLREKLFEVINNSRGMT